MPVSLKSQRCLGKEKILNPYSECIWKQVLLEELVSSSPPGSRAHSVQRLLQQSEVQSQHSWVAHLEEFPPAYMRPCGGELWHKLPPPLPDQAGSWHWCKKSLTFASSSSACLCCDGPGTAAPERQYRFCPLRWRCVKGFTQQMVSNPSKTLPG